MKKLANYLRTTLHEIHSKSEYEKIITDNNNVIIVCGRNGPMCLPVYGVLEALQGKDKYKNISMNVMPFDIQDADVIRRLPETQGFMGLPYTVYFKNGKVVKATSSIQDAPTIKAIFENSFLN